MPISRGTAQVRERNAPTATRRQRTVRRHVTTRTLAKQDLDECDNYDRRGRVYSCNSDCDVGANFTADLRAHACSSLNRTVLIGGNLGFGWSARQLFRHPFGYTLTPTTKQQVLWRRASWFQLPFWRGVLIGADAEFDWLPDSNNIHGTSLVAGSTCVVDCQQLVANDRDWPLWLRMGSGAPLRQRRGWSVVD